MNLHIRLSVVCLAALLGIAMGCEKPAARAEPPPPKVSVANPVLRELVDVDRYNGWLDAVETCAVVCANHTSDRRADQPSTDDRSQSCKRRRKRYIANDDRIHRISLRVFHR